MCNYAIGILILLVGDKYVLLPLRIFLCFALRHCAWIVLWMFQKLQFWQDMIQGFEKNRYLWSDPISFRGIIKYCALSLLKVAGNCPIIILYHYQGIDPDKNKTHVKFCHSYGPNSDISQFLWVGMVSLFYEKLGELKLIHIWQTPTVTIHKKLKFW